MEDHQKLKEIVREKYSRIVRENETGKNEACGCSCGSATDYTTFSDNYENLEGYEPEADLGLGCGIPTDHARIKPGNTVIDLGSGAGNDCFVARALVGEKGRVIGIDFSEEMIDKARQNARKLGLTNVDFVSGDIENIPLAENLADVVVSNCVINLVPDKEKAFSEIYRILKPGGHFCISDVVLNAVLPFKIKEAAEMYAGCVAGAMLKNEYLSIIEKTGFMNIRTLVEKVITIPDEVMLNFITPAELRELKAAGNGIESITVFASKPLNRE